MRHDEQLSPVGGPIWTPTMKALAAVTVLAQLLVGYRFFAGIGATTALNDGYPWGAWKIMNVVVLTALGSGGYAMALLVYVMNRGRYHALVRTAILTSALGYSTAVLALGVDIGRPWHFWRLFNLSGWNLHSVLLEIAICVSVYLVFLWLEMAHPFMEVWEQRPHGRLRDFAIKATPILDRAFPWLIATAVLLPSMHQSSLGSLFLLAGPRLHALWNTPLLPLLFLFSCWALGFAAVLMTALFARVIWDRPVDMPMLSALARIIGWVLLAFLVIRWADIMARHELDLALSLDRASIAFLIETLLLGWGAIGLLTTRLRNSPDGLFRMCGLIVLGGSLYRLNASIIGFMPGDNWSYFPSVAELIVSFGFITAGGMGYLYIVKRFPILAAPVPRRAVANERV